MEVRHPARRPTALTAVTNFQRSPMEDVSVRVAAELCTATRTIWVRTDLSPRIFSTNQAHPESIPDAIAAKTLLIREVFYE